MYYKCINKLYNYTGRIVKSCYYPPWKNMWCFIHLTNLNPLYQILVQIVSVVLEKKMKIWQFTDRQTDGQMDKQIDRWTNRMTLHTKDNRCLEKLTWAFSSGKLKKQDKGTHIDSPAFTHWYKEAHQSHLDSQNNHHIVWRPPHSPLHYTQTQRGYSFHLLTDNT